MKKVFRSASEVIHLFAQQIQSEARCNNVFFETPYNSNLNYGTKLYSYGHHYLLAEFLDKNTVLINDSGYSHTTSQHISQAFQALRQYKIFRYTETNLNSVHNKVINLQRNLARAKKPELYINQILAVWEPLNEYLIYTKAKNYKSNPLYKEIKKIVSLLNNSPAEYKEALKIAAIKKDKSEKLKAKKLLIDQLEKFRTYKTNFVKSEFNYLRISLDKNFVETSGNLKVDIKEAKILYLMIKAGKDIKGHKIGYYTVISINGTLKIGCHNIERKEIENFASLMNW